MQVGQKPLHIFVQCQMKNKFGVLEYIHNFIVRMYVIVHNFMLELT